MAVKQRTSNELRCVCSREPLLATYGLTDRGESYLHVKIYKQRRIFGEIIVLGGRVSLHCRECLRWYTVNLVPRQRPHLVEEQSEDALANILP